MIVRRYGSKLLSVRPNFDSRAMTEIGFTRDGELQTTTEEFDASHEKVSERALTAEAEGDVQGEVEDALLASLSEQLAKAEAEAGDGEVLLIENQPGTDHPKTVGTQVTTVEAGANRLRFGFTVDPPLRVSVYRRRG